jgi:uncharacterized protein (DUF2249 family)/hemerythrin-like domain-containing protein
MSDPAQRHRLADEHRLLQQEVERREQRVRDVLAEGRWPAEEVRGLLDYLRYEVLDQAVNEERLLYPLTEQGFADPRIQQLVDDHVQLRDMADRLTELVDSPADAQDAQQLSATLDELRERLDRHLRNEQEVLRPVAETGVEPIRRPFRSHEWFALTEGSLVDMDRLPRAFGHSAVLDRLARMRPGERVEVSSGGRLQTLQDLLTRRGMTGVYGWAYLEEGPQRWRAEVTRRSG